jgi:ribonuclease HI
VNYVRAGAHCARLGDTIATPWEIEDDGSSPAGDAQTEIQGSKCPPLFDTGWTASINRTAKSHRGAPPTAAVLRDIDWTLVNTEGGTGELIALTFDPLLTAERSRTLILGTDGSFDAKLGRDEDDDDELRAEDAADTAADTETSVNPEDVAPDLARKELFRHGERRTRMAAAVVEIDANGAEVRKWAFQPAGPPSSYTAESAAMLAALQIVERLEPSEATIYADSERFRSRVEACSKRGPRRVAGAADRPIVAECLRLMAKIRDSQTELRMKFVFSHLTDGNFFATADGLGGLARRQPPRTTSRIYPGN